MRNNLQIRENIQNLRKDIDRGRSDLVGIISYNIHSDMLNYGAALHSFAFQQYLYKLGAASVIIDYIPTKIQHKNLKYPILNLKRLGGGFNHHIMNWGLGFRAHLRKHRKFINFFDRFFVKTPTTYRCDDLMQAESLDGLDISTFVTESDVTWKSYRQGDFDPAFYLQMPSAEGKRKIAYAPTLSSRPFSEEDEETFRRLVKDYSAISTRESQGAEYLSDILDRDVDWCLDPTLLLSAEEYSQIAVQPKEKGYVLMYNCMKNDRVMVREAERFASSKGLKLIEISNFYENSIKFDHTVKTDVGIEEWLGYFKHADYVICNAFHGFCFSVVFGKQVLLFERDGSDFRMRNITSALGAPQCLIPHDDKKIPEYAYGSESIIDYETVRQRLEVLQQKSKAFIDTHIISKYSIE